MRTLFLLILVLGISFTSTAQVISVPNDQPTIQDGLNAASFGDTVLVAPGTYFENITWPNTNGIKLIAEGDTSDTFIDGSEIERVIHIQGHAIDTLTLIEGFTIQKGRGIGTYSGSGIFCESSGVTISKCRMTDNTANIGGGLCFVEAMGVVTDCTIDKNIGNSVLAVGGLGADLHESSVVRFERCNIINNRAVYCRKILGCGLSVRSNSTAHLYDCNISGNTAAVSSTGESRGVGILLMQSSNIRMTRCNVENNKSTASPKWCIGTAINVDSAEEVYFEDVSIIGNEAAAPIESNMGIVHINSASSEFRNVSIEQNVLYLGLNVININRGILITNGNFYGEELKIRDNELMADETPLEIRGGVVNIGGSGRFELKNSLITGNLLHSQLQGNTYNGVIKFNGTPLAKITNVTIADNFNNSGNATFSTTVDADSTNLSVVNTILWNPNIENELVGVNVDVSHSDVQGYSGGFNSIDADPMFIGNGDYRLQTFSPCINSGTIATAPSTDIEGNPRPMPIGTNPDMGAYEDDNPSTSVSENVGSKQWLIYPNPTNGFVQISSNEKIETIQVFSAIGKLVYEFTGRNQVIDLTALPSGIYSLVIKSESKSFSKKLVLAK